MNVSAVISAYFCEEFLKERIENLLEQTAHPEIIVVTNRNLPEWEIAEQFDEVILVEGGEGDFIPTVYAAWNTGIKAASGELVTNANSDDRYKNPDSLQKMVDALIAHPHVQLVYSDALITDGYNGDVRGKFAFNEGFFDTLLQKGCFIGPAPLWRKRIHNTIGYFDERFEVAGDYLFWMRLAKHYGKNSWYHIPETLIVYSKRKGSLENRSNVRKIWETARARALITGRLSEEDFNKSLSIESQ